MSMIEKDLGSGLPPSSQASLLEKIFKLSERKTNVKTEILAGITSFMTMSYIIG
jgi:AGZA family xanthine/uracil permease-like MFS transporter